MSALVRALMGSALLCNTSGAQLPADSATALLKQRIRQTSPLVATREADLQLATARRGATGLRPAALLSAEAEETPSVVNVPNAGSLRVDVTQSFVPASVRRSQQTVADYDIQRAELELAVTQQSLSAAVDQLVARAAGGHAIAARLQSEDSLLRGAEEALRTRFAVGDARYVDVLRLRTERLRIETEITRGRTDEVLNTRQLVRLAAAADTTGLAALARDAVTGTASRFLSGSMATPPTLDSLLSVSVARRLAALGVAQAEAAKRLVIAQQRPALTASIGVQRFTIERGGPSLGITAGVSLPLARTTRRANDARVTVADREISVARAEQRLRETRLVATINAAFDRYDAARAQIAAFDAALLRGAREEREAALASYRTGGMTLIELLDFERALAQAEVTRIRGQVDAADALLDLLTASLGTDDVAAGMRGAR